MSEARRDASAITLGCHINHSNREDRIQPSAVIPVENIAVLLTIDYKKRRGAGRSFLNKEGVLLAC